MADYNSAYTGVQIDANLALAATAVQDADLATVATTGAYSDLTGKPTLGTAAATASTDYATAAQGALANTAVQPADDAADLGSGAATDGYVLTADGAGGAAWEAASGGGGTPGGTDTQVQFNDGGAFGGDSGFTFDKTNNTLGLGGGAITASDPIIDMAQTWNNGAVAFTAVKANVTDTASAAGSLLMDLQVGGVSRFRVGKTGSIYSAAGGIQAIAASADTDILQGRWGDTFSVLRARIAGGVPSFDVASIGFFRFSNDSLSVSTFDLILARDAANTLAQRNGVNAQAFNLYNTYTDASNYERGVMKWNGNVLEIGTEKLGTGATRHIKIGPDYLTGVGLSAGTATGAYSVACGQSTSSGSYSFSALRGNATAAATIAMGSEVTASHSGSIVFGRYTSSSNANQMALGYSLFTPNNEVCQVSTYVLNATTTGTTPTEMSTGFGSITRMALRPSSTLAFEITVAGRSDGGVDNATYMYRGMIKRDASNNTVLVGTVDNFYTNETDAAWDVAVTADDTNESLKVMVTGVAATNINWTGKVILTEVGNV